MTDNIIDIVKIKEIITNDHADFLKTFGSQLEKVAADSNLLAELAITKLKYVLNEFKGNIIDNIEVVNYKNPCKCLKISKKYNDNYVNIITNGVDAFVTGSSFISPLNVDDRDNMVFYDICSDDFDWCLFAKRLLEYIHIMIYERKQAGAAKLDIWLKDKDVCQK